MRLRHIPGSEEQVLKSPYVIQEPEKYQGSWSRLSGGRPVELEIGMGKGKFLMDMARLHPNIYYIGIERYATVLLKALRKMDSVKLPNLCFLCVDAKRLPEIFQPGEVSGIYLNFSDPWPKDRHARRRLTSGEFLNVYDQLLDQDGVVEFKTDNRGLFEYSMESIPEAGWTISACTFDLHNDPVMGQDNVMTEYETKFSAMGNPICKLIACRQK